MRTLYIGLLAMVLPSVMMISTLLFQDRLMNSDNQVILTKELDNVGQQNAALMEHAQELKELIVGSSNNSSNEEEAVVDCSGKLQKAHAIISRMETKSKEQIPDTRQFVSDSNFTSQNRVSEPSIAYENTRRKVENEVNDVWNYIREQLYELKNVTGYQNRTDVKINHILKAGREQLRYIMANVDYLRRVDGYSSWRHIESKKLSNLIQQRFHFLQNPPNCSKAKKIVCNFKVECGFGCQVHHLSYCMIMAYATGRTLILESKGWAYAKEGWDKFFLPLSDTCLDRQGETTSNWGSRGSIEDIQVVEIPIVGDLPHDLKPDFLPLAIPEDISERLMAVHGFSAVWWVGQIMAFIIRPQPAVKEFIVKKTAALGFTHPIVGIQVRRTDKLNWEAAFHGIEEYMFHAEEFYQKLERKQKEVIRKIFLATDDVGLLKEAQRKYPDYVFVSDSTITQSAGISSRFTEDSLSGIIVDIHLLAHSDFLVCTFSSNVCRLAYELMQHYHVDATTQVRSLDSRYYYHGQNSNSENKAVRMPLYEGADNFHL